MALANELNFEQIKEILADIKTSSEETRTSLQDIDKEIKESVGTNGTAWDGVAATEFRQSWDELAEKIPSFITTVENQVRNISTVIEKMSATDENGTGTVNY